MIIVSPWHGPSTDHLSLSPASPGAAPGKKFGCDWGLRIFDHGQTLLAGLRVRLHHLLALVHQLPHSHKANSHGSAVEQQLGRTPQHTCLWSPVGTPGMAAHDLFPTQKQLPRRGHGTANPQAFLILFIFSSLFLKPSEKIVLMGTSSWRWARFQAGQGCGSFFFLKREKDHFQVPPAKQTRLWLTPSCPFPGLPMLI